MLLRYDVLYAFSLLLGLLTGNGTVFLIDVDGPYVVFLCLSDVAKFGIYLSDVIQAVGCLITVGAIVMLTAGQGLLAILYCLIIVSRLVVDTADVCECQECVGMKVKVFIDGSAGTGPNMCW